MTARLRHALRAPVLIAVGTLLTRILGFVREILAAAYFGVGPVFDAFVVAFSVPNLFRRVLGEEMFERAFLPPFSRMVAEGEGGRARAYLGRIFAVVGSALLAVTLLLLLFLPQVVTLLAPGLEPEAAATALSMARLILPFLLLIGLASFAGALCLFQGYTLTFAMAPAVTNIVVVVVVVAFHRRLGVTSLVVAWLLGAAAAVVVQLPAVTAIVRRLPVRRKGGEPAPVGDALREGSAVLASSVVTKGVEVVDRIVASLIGVGAISALYYSFRIVHLPFSVLSLAVNRSIAPQLSHCRGRGDEARFGLLVERGLLVNLMLLAPVMVFFMLYATEVVELFYGRGRFDAQAVRLTTRAFVFYSLAILPMGLISLLNRVYAALERNRIPLVAALAGGLVNVVLDLILYRTPLEQGGIALASAIGLSCQTLVLLVLLVHCGVRPPWSRLSLAGGRLLAPLAGLIIVALLLRPLVPTEGSFFVRAVGLGAVGLAALIPYAVVVLLLWPLRAPGRMRVVLTGGGTGGHVYPALAIGRMLDRAGMVEELLYVGVAGRAEEAIVPRQRLRLETVASAPWAGGSPLARVRALLTLARGTLQSVIILARFRPHLVVATGGYASAPTVAAAFLLKPALKLRIVVEEQNLVPGVLNKVASLLADVVLVSFRESAYFIWSNRCVFTGYPVREAYLEANGDTMATRHHWGVPDDGFLVVVCGGSMGARSLNRSLVTALPDILAIPGVVVVHVIGMMRTPSYDALGDTIGRLSKVLGEAFDRDGLIGRDPSGRVAYHGLEYTHDFVELQRAADLIISRAGAGALAEVAALGKASLLVPKRKLPGDHQELNAIAIAEAGAAEVLFERPEPSTAVDQIDASDLAGAISELLGDPELRHGLASRAGALSQKDVEGRVVAAVRAVVDGGEFDLITEISEPPFVRYQRQFDILVDDLGRKTHSTLYHRLYEIKIEEFLASPNYLVVNRGIKLVGALRRSDLYPKLIQRFPSFKGFQKRNTLIALARAESFDCSFASLTLSGLNDPYWEVRTAAIRLYIRFASAINRLPLATTIHSAIKHRIHRRLEPFEVRAEAIRAAVRFMDHADFLTTVRPFLEARQVRLREAVLDAVEAGLDEGLLVEPDEVRRVLQRMLITTSQFRPEFAVRRRFVEVMRMLGGHS